MHLSWRNRTFVYTEYHSHFVPLVGLENGTPIVCSECNIGRPSPQVHDRCMARQRMNIEIENDYVNAAALLFVRC